MAWGRRKKKNHPKKSSERSWNGYLSEMGPHVESLGKTTKLRGGVGGKGGRPQASKETQKASLPPHPIISCSGRTEREYILTHKKG